MSRSRYTVRNRFSIAAIVGPLSHGDARGQRHDAMDTVGEYWAAGTLWWFWTNYSQIFVDAGVQHTVWSPDDLERYDPKLYAILSRVYADHRVPADVYHGKKWR